MEKEVKKNKKNIFYFGIVVFAIGTLLTYFGYNVGPSPVYGFDIYYLPFLNYVSIAGIIIAVVGYIMGRRKNGEN